MKEKNQLIEKVEMVIAINERLKTRNKLLSELLGNITQYLEGFVKAAGQDNPALADTEGYQQALKCCTEIKVLLAEIEAKGMVQQ